MRLPEACEGARHGGGAEVNARGGFPGRTVLRERGIRGGDDLRQERCRILRPNPAMSARPRQRGYRASLALLGAPPLDRADPDTEEAGRLGLREPGVDGSQQPLAEVGGVLLHSPIVAPAQLLRNPL